MEIRRRTAGGVTILDLDGQLEADTLGSFRDAVQVALDSGALRICMNCSRLTFVTSTGLGYLVKLAKELREQGGDLAFSEPSEFFAAAVRTLELHHLFEVAGTDAEAVEHLGG